MDVVGNGVTMGNWEHAPKFSSFLLLGENVYLTSFSRGAF